MNRSGNIFLPLLFGIALFIGIFSYVVKSGYLSGNNQVFAEETIVLDGIADSMVRSNNPTKNFGSVTVLDVAGKHDTKTYLKFNLASLAGKQILATSLKITFSSGGSQSAIHTANLVADSGWGETAINFNNAPVTSTAIGTFNGASSGSTIEIPLAVDIVKGYIGSNFSMALRTNNQNGFSVYSKEHSNGNYRPKLVVTVQSSVTPTVTSAPNPTIYPTVTTVPNPSPTGSPSTSGLWLNHDEIMNIPISGESGCTSQCHEAWQNVLEAANHSTLDPDLSDQSDNTDVYTFAKALVYARTGNQDYRNQVRQTLDILVDNHPPTGSGSWDSLGILRSMYPYVIAADLIDLKNFPSDSFDNGDFRQWLTDARFAVAEGTWSVVTGQEERPNNFGTHGSASRIAADLYLGDQVDLDRAIKVFKGYLGDRSSYADFNYGDLCYQSNPNAPVGINPVGAKLNIGGVLRNADGIIPDDQRRSGCPPTYPFPKENYVWEALQGATVASELLYRAGYDSYSWGNQALLRAVTWLHDPEGTGENYPWYSAEGDDTWIPWIINKRYNKNFPTIVTSSPSLGKGMGLADWTHR
jgi:hypothetical protein